MVVLSHFRPKKSMLPRIANNKHVHLLSSIQNLPEIWTDGDICAVLHAETSGNRPELREAEPFVEVAGVDVPLDDGVELEDPKAVRLGLRKSVEDKLLAEMPSAAV